MRRTVLIVVVCIAVIVLAVAAVFAWGRLRGPDAVQTKAMALLTRDLKPKAMHNAWPALWLNRYAVPPEKMVAVYAADVKRMRAWIRKREAGSDVAFVSRAKEAYPEAPKLDAKQRETLCGQNGAHCLQKVREHAEAIAQALAIQHARLMRFKAMSHDDALWDTMPPYVGAPGPHMFPLQGLWLSSAALDFVRGRHAQALASMCTNARMLRRLRAHANKPVMMTLLGNWMGANERLLAAMLSHLPPQQSVPATCHEAFAPIARTDVDLCPTQQWLYATLVQTKRMITPATEHRPAWLMWVYFDRAKGVRAMVAPHYAWLCRTEVRDAMLADRMSADGPPPARYDWLDEFTNVFGVQAARQLARQPDMLQRQLRLRTEDYAAGLRLMAWVFRMHGRNPSLAALKQQFDLALPQLRQSGNRTIRLSADGTRVSAAYYYTNVSQPVLVLALRRPTPASIAHP